MSVIRINFLKRLPIILMVMLLALAILPAMVSGQEANDEESAFQNPAQAQKAENVAYAAALNSEDGDLAKAVEKADAAEDQLDAAIDNLAAVKADPDADADDRKAARQAVRKAERKVERTRAKVAEELSRVSGEYKDEIEASRLAGEGWGVIAKDLGLHPSILGNRYGQMKANQHTVQSRHRNRFGDDGEFSATTRDVKNAGLAKGHNKSAFGKSNGKSKADSFGIDNNGKAKGKSNGKGGGKGGGKGNGKDK